MGEKQKPENMPEEHEVNIERVFPDPNAEFAFHLLHQTTDEDLTHLADIYNAHNEKTRVRDYEVKIKGDSVNILYASELLLGNQDSDFQFYLDTLDHIKNLPEEEHPDLIVLSGFMQGYFKHLERPRRKTLVPEMASMNQQYRFAKDMIDAAKELGVPVIYNMGDDDHRILVEHNIEYFRRLDKLAKKHSQFTQSEDNDYDHLDYKQVNDIQGHEQWVPMLEFQKKVCFPYRLHAGRRLRTADEMYEIFGEEYGEAARVEEYFLLYQAHEHRNEQYERGVKRIHPRKIERRLLDVEAFKATDNRRPYRAGDLIITDDVNLHMKTDGAEYTDKIRHYFAYSPKPMYVTHIKKPLQYISESLANGRDVPDGFTVQNNQEEVGVLAGERLISSTGGLLKAENYINRQGQRSDVPGDISKRIHMRGRIHPPSMRQHERFDDGHHEITIHTDTLREKSFSLEERIAVPMLCDWQTGSITARPELQVLWMDMIRTKVLGRMAAQLMIAGDMVHGRNYSDFPNESQSTGLMSTGSQEEFLLNMVETDISNYTKEQVDALVGITLQIGNHEWNTGTTKWHGYPFIKGLELMYRSMYVEHGYSREEAKQKAKYQDLIKTQNREVFHTFSSIAYLGAYGIHNSHFMLDKGSGGGGGIPLYQAHAHSVGASSNKKSIDIDIAGHWHHGSYGVFGEKLALTAPSLAGVSGFEWRRGLRASVGATMLELGGGLPPKIVFYPERAILNHRIKEGPFSDEALAEEGYTTDEDFDRFKHTVLSGRSSPKNALQKKIRDMMMDASERAESTAELRE